MTLHLHKGPLRTINLDVFEKLRRILPVVNCSCKQLYIMGPESSTYSMWIEKDPCNYWQTKTCSGLQPMTNPIIQELSEHLNVIYIPSPSVMHPQSVQSEVYFVSINYFLIDFFVPKMEGSNAEWINTICLEKNGRLIFPFLPLFFSLGHINSFQ